MANGRNVRAWLTPGAREFFFLAVFAFSVLFLWQIIRYERALHNPDWTSDIEGANSHHAHSLEGIVDYNPEGTLSQVHDCLRLQVENWREKIIAGHSSISIGPLALPSDSSEGEHHSAPPRQSMPYYGNGYVASEPAGSYISVLGLYNGIGVNSHIAKIPSAANANVKGVDDQHDVTIVDFADGCIYRFSVLPLDNDCACVRTRWYAHLVYPSAIIQEIKVVLPANHPEWIELDPYSASASLDVSTSLMVDYDLPEIVAVMHETIEREDGAEGTGSFVAMLHTRFPERIAAQGGVAIWRGLCALKALTLDAPLAGERGQYSTTLAQEVASIYGEVSEKLENSPQSLLEEHRTQWKRIFRQSGWIDIQGRGAYIASLRAALHAGVYYMLSSISTQIEATPVSPCGLPGYCYGGHVFWDAEMWVFPALLAFIPKMARSVLDYRIARMKMAAKAAENAGYEGLLFPWESAATGVDVCPVEMFSKAELHVTGDIAVMAGQYFYATRSVKWLRDAGYPLLSGIAKFWASRVTKDTDDGHVYEIRSVVPPDEYAGVVDNSVFTNQVAREALRLAARASRLLEIYTDEVSEWETIGRHVLLPYSVEKGYHPEFAGKTHVYVGATAKQADVVLLGYPLNHIMPPAVRKNDLNFYRAVTDKNGPAMTDSMFAIGYLDVGEPSLAQAHMQRVLSHIDFASHLVFYETSTRSTSPHFITGIGGFLQSMIYGYAGVRILPGLLRIRPTPLVDAEHYTLNGLNYAGWALTLTVANQEVSLSISKAEDTPESDSWPGQALYICVGTVGICLGAVDTANGGNSYFISDDRRIVQVPGEYLYALHENQELALVLKDGAARLHIFASATRDELQNGVQRYAHKQKFASETNENSLTDPLHGHTEFDATLYTKVVVNPRKPPADHGHEIPPVYGRKFKIFMVSVIVLVILAHLLVGLIMLGESGRRYTRLPMPMTTSLRLKRKFSTNP